MKVRVRVRIGVSVRVLVRVRVMIRVRVCVRGLKLKGLKYTHSNQEASIRVPYCCFSSLPLRAGSG